MFQTSFFFWTKWWEHSHHSSSYSSNTQWGQSLYIYILAILYWCWWSAEDNHLTEIIWKPYQYNYWAHHITSHKANSFWNGLYNKLEILCPHNVLQKETKNILIPFFSTNKLMWKISQHCRYFKQKKPNISNLNLFYNFYSILCPLFWKKPLDYKHVKCGHPRVKLVWWIRNNYNW